MNKITLTFEQIDLATKMLKDMRTAMTNLATNLKRHDEAAGGYMAAKAKAREAMDADNFDDLNVFNQAAKKHHKMMADLQDRRIELEESLTAMGEQMMAWPTTPLSAPEPKPVPVAEVTEQPSENTDLEQAA